MDMTKVLSISIHALLTESDWLLGTEFQTLPLISIHALLTESDAFSPLGALFLDISIHALLAESDGEPAGGGGHHGISIHALLAESDYCAPPPERIQSSFQSTLSLRRATAVSMSWDPRDRFQSTLSLRRATPAGWTQRMGWDISIHALLAESDCVHDGLLPGGNISIHALLAESDSIVNRSTEPVSQFQSTLSLRRATASSR